MSQRNVLHLVFCVDDNFCLPLSVLIRSLKDKSSWKVQCHVLSAGLTAENQQRLAHYTDDKCDIRFYLLDELKLKGMNISNAFSERLSIATYFRFLIADVLPSDIQKVLFLDADMLCLEDPVNLYQQQIDGKVAAVVEDGKLSESQRWNALGLSGGAYFNAGMMLLDIQLWRQRKVAEKCFELIASGMQWEYNDQDILNLVLDEEVSYMPIGWNCQSHHLENKADVTPCIVHFTGAEKPWQVSCIHPYTEAFRETLSRSSFGDIGLEHYLDSFDKSIVSRLSDIGSAPFTLLIYGCGQRGRRLYHYFVEHLRHIKVVGFIDKSAPEEFEGLPVYSSYPEGCLDNVLIGSNAFFDEIQSQLLASGVQQKNII